MMKALSLSERNGWARFVTMQNHYNLLYREEEREMLPLCQDLGVGVIPWSPLARGRLTRDWDADTARTETDEFGRSLYRDEDRATVDRVAAVAERRGVPRAQVALAWVMAQPAVTSPIVGVTKPHHLSDAVAAVDLELSADEVEELGAGYLPHAIAGHQ
jgi:aryl-alcohol dehydrogenase (NADP+)